MANYTLTTSAQEVGRNTEPTVGARLLAWYSDATSTSAVVHLKLQAISQGITYTGTNKDYELTLDNTATGTVPWTYAPLPADTWVDVREITQTVSSGQTVSVSGKVWTYVYDDAWVSGNTVTLPNFSTPPTGLSISNLQPGVNSFSADVSITGWGTGVGTDKYIELQCWTKGMNYPRRYQANRSGAQNANITVNNDSSYTQPYGPLIISGNTEYTIGAYATNGNTNTGSQNMGNAVTLAYPADLSDIMVSGNSVDINYTIRSDGGKYDKTYEYSTDGGTTWTTFATVSGGSATSGSFTISNLEDGKSYVVKHRVTTTAGVNNGTDFIFAIPMENKFYGSESGVATKINKLYCAAPIFQTYYYVTALNNNPKVNLSQFQNKYESTYGGKMLVRPVYLDVSNNSTHVVTLYFSDSSFKILFTYTNAYTNQGAAWGFPNNVAPLSGSVSSEQNTYVSGFQTKVVKKLYGSVGGVAKRIY